MVPPSPPHPIVDTLNVITAFPAAQTVTVSTAGGRTPQAFLETSPQSFSKRDLSVLRTGGQVTVDEAKGDRRGPLVIGAALSADAPNAPPPAPPDAAAPGVPPAPRQARLVVIGDSDFAANGSLGFGGNRDLFMNALNWLAGAESLISVRPRDPEDRRITLPPSGRGVTVLVAAAIPIACFAAGLYTWWRRR